MKKQELIHLHGLLAQVSNYYEAQTGEKIGRESYEDTNVRPTSIQKSKTEHKEAVFALSEDLTGSIESKVEQPVSAAAD